MAADTLVADRAATPARRRPRASRRALVVAALGLVLAAGGLAAPPAAAAADPVKVTIVVGPSGANTALYLRQARQYAAQARAFGATVVEVYTPNATWARVRAAARGANLLIVMGHGNGFPNPYGSTLDPKKVDGLGLNPYAGSGNTRTAYYGEWYVERYLELAPNAVVLLNHLCYSAGSSEPGRADPTLSVARTRVDNFGAGFLRAGATAVFATLGDGSYLIDALFTSDRTLGEVFRASPDATGAWDRTFASLRTPGMTTILDPERPGVYHRSVVGDLSVTTAAWRD